VKLLSSSMEKEMKDVEISAINAEIVHEIQYEK